MSINAETLDRFMTLVLDAADIESALKLLHPNVVVHEPENVPYPGDFKGPNGFASLLGHVFASAELAIHDRELLDAGDTVVARFSGTMTSHVTGKSMPLAIIEIYRFTDGLISDVDVFYKDTKAIVDLHS